MPKHPNGMPWFDIPVPAIALRHRAPPSAWKLGQSGNLKGRPRSRQTEGLNQKDLRRDYVLRNKFGISIFEYKELFHKQCGVCAICGNPEIKKQSRGRGSECTVDSLHVDHDHQTGKVRGLLCYRCNTGIGKLFDNPDLLRKAAEYLERESSNDAQENH